MSDAIGELAGMVVEAVLSRDNGSRPPPTEPNRIEFFGMALGLLVALAGIVGLAVCAYETRLEWYVAATPAVRATIVASAAKQTGSNRFTDALLDYERQQASAPVACHRAPARFGGHSDDFAVGKTIDVHPQQGSCYRPVYAPDIGRPRAVLAVSAVALTCGLALFGTVRSCSRRRRHQVKKLTHAS